MEKAETSNIRQEILSYLIEHPNAQDTLEGIMNWWLLERQIKHWTVQVEAALAELAEQGVVVEQTGQDGKKHYRVNRGKLGKLHPKLKGQPQ